MHPGDPQPVHRELIKKFRPRFRCRCRVRIKGNGPFWVRELIGLCMDNIAPNEQALTARGDAQTHVAGRVTRQRHGGHPWCNLCLRIGFEPLSCVHIGRDQCL